MDIHDKITREVTRILDDSKEVMACEFPVDEPQPCDETPEPECCGQ